MVRTYRMLRNSAAFWSRTFASLFLLTLVVSAFGPAASLAQENGEPRDETLSGGVQSSGGYGAPTVALTTLNGEMAAMVGGQGG
jgi:hypothetical protein